VAEQGKEAEMEEAVHGKDPSGFSRSANMDVDSLLICESRAFILLSIVSPRCKKSLSESRQTWESIIWLTVLK